MNGNNIMESKRMVYTFNTISDIMIDRIVWVILQYIENENVNMVHVYEKLLQKSFRDEFNTTRYKFLNTDENSDRSHHCKSHEQQSSFIILNQDIDIITMRIVNDTIGSYINFEEYPDKYYMYLSKTISDIIRDCGGISDKEYVYHSHKDIAKKNDGSHYEEYLKHELNIKPKHIDESL